MKKNIKALSSFGAAAGILATVALMAPAAYAISLSTGTGVGVSLGSSTGDSGAQTSVQASGSSGSASGQTQASSGTTVSNSTDSNSSTADQSSGDSSMNSDTSASAQAGSANSVLDIASPIVILRSDIDANTGSSNAAAQVSAQTDQSANAIQPTSVATSSDLSAYANASMQNDPNIDSVQLQNNQVGMSYSQSGKLFGFIPVKVDANTTVNADGTAKVQYPWYRFLVSLDGGSVKSDMQAQMKDSVVGAQTASGSASFTAAQEAQILSQMQAYMKNHESGSASASANVSATAAATQTQ